MKANAPWPARGMCASPERHCSSCAAVTAHPKKSCQPPSADALHLRGRPRQHDGFLRRRLALCRMSLTRRSAWFSRSSHVIRLAIPVVTPGLRPVSRSAVLTHSSSVCAVQPLWAEIDRIVAQRERGLRLVIQRHSQGAVPHLRREYVRPRARHRSSLSGVGASDTNEVVHGGAVPDGLTGSGCGAKCGARRGRTAFARAAAGDCPRSPDRRGANGACR